MNLCPSYKHLRAAKDGGRAAAADNDDFYDEVLDLLDDGKIANLKAIRANTPYLVSIRMFVCRNLKNQPQNYCGDLSDPQAEKKTCESNKTDYIFFYVDKSEYERTENKPKGGEPVYLLAFARYSKEDEIPQKIVAEAKKTAEWLGIADSVIQCYVFYYTDNNLYNTLDRGTLKKKYDEQCRDQKYFFQFQNILINEKPLWLNINGGSPKFNIKIQEM